MLTELFEIEMVICIKMDFPLNNLKRFIYLKKNNNQQTILIRLHMAHDINSLVSLSNVISNFLGY